MVEEELKILQALKHPNIIYLHEIINDPNKTNEEIYLVTEYHSSGSIGDQLKSINK
jgi:serine/threonine protein kinase